MRRKALYALFLCLPVLWFPLVVQQGLAQPHAAPLVVMNLAAHPDDEDGSTLAYYRHGHDAIAYSVIFTRGEGGQNEIGPELYEELGAIRTAETERAARQLGTQVFFLNFKDFGYSKSAEETYERWGGKDEVTSRLVYLIRKLKPDVLFTNHDTLTVGPTRQHGHHQAVGIAAYEAFELAADSTYHPDQLDEPGIDAWQPSRLFLRLWSSDGSHDVAVPVGDRDRTTGLTYAEIAARGLHEHASQGMEMFAERIAEWDATYFVQYRTTVDQPAPADDLAGGLEPNRTAEPDVTYWIDSGRVQPLDAFDLNDESMVPGQSVDLRWNADRLPERPFRLELFGAVDTSIVVRDDSPPVAHLTVSSSAVPTVPEKRYQYHRYLSHPPIGYASYAIPSGTLTAAGYLDAEVAPPLYLEAVEEVVRLREGGNEVEYDIRVFDDAIENVTLTAALANDREENVLDQRQETISDPTTRSTREQVVLRLPADTREGSYTGSLSAFSPTATNGAATADDFLAGQLFSVEAPAGLRVGVVASYDNTLSRALSELGVETVMLDSTDLADRAFDDLHTIVVDIRAYLVRRDLRTYNDRILDWVRRGGHLIVNYQKTFEWNPDQPDPFDAARNNPGNFAPYPIQIGRDRVTRETAPVSVLLPDHPFFNDPNEIGDEAWQGWVQERGLYFPARYDDRYLELLSVNDPGEAPHHGSTLLADVGRGTYVYTALVWYRQLKEHHPGAYRVFANMISLPLVDGRRAAP